MLFPSNSTGSNDTSLGTRSNLSGFHQRGFLVTQKNRKNPVKAYSSFFLPVKRIRLRLIGEQLQLQRKLLGLRILVKCSIDFLCWHLLFSCWTVGCAFPHGGHLTTDGFLDQPYPCGSSSWWPLSGSRWGADPLEKTLWSCGLAGSGVTGAADLNRLI